MSCSEYWSERLAAKKALLAKLEDALAALSVSGVQSYTLDTGQTRQVVTRTEVGSLRNTITQLEGEIDTLSARCGDGAHAVGQPDNWRPVY
jgi:hypothetical protein